MTYRSDVEALAARKVALDAEIKARSKERDDAERALAHAHRQLRLPVLENVRVASPCKESWSAMQGDERVRHCGKCDQQVFDLSAMTREEAETLIRDKNGQLCATYYTRADGTVMTKDCPDGVRKIRRKVAVAAGAALALLGSGAYASGAFDSEPDRHDDGRTMGAIAMPPALPAHCEQLRAELRSLAECEALPKSTVQAIESAWLHVDHEARNRGLIPEQLSAMERGCELARLDLDKTREQLCPPAPPVQPLEKRDGDRDADGNRE
jgi:hypothetical protein